MSKWTPEPWRVTGTPGGWLGIGSQADGVLFKMAFNNVENAARAVACVNALAGVKDPESVLSQLLKVAQRARGTCVCHATMRPDVRCLSCMAGTAICEAGV